MGKAGACCAVLTVALTAGLVAPAAAETDWDAMVKRRHWVHVGAGAGPTQVQAADHEREVEGITFQFTAEGDDLGAAAFFGWWITDHIGLEIAYWNFGSVAVPFTFQDPHDNSSGTGDSDISFSGPSASLLFGHDLGDFQVFGRVGAISWSRDMDTRFDIAGEPALHRALGKSGTDLTFGAGIGWRFHRGWSLQAQYERTSFEDDTIDLFSFGIQYDFLDLVLGRSR